MDYADGAYEGGDETSDMWKYVAIALLVIFVIYYIWYKNKSSPPAAAPAAAPPATATPTEHMEASNSCMCTGGDCPACKSKFEYENPANLQADSDIRFTRGDSATQHANDVSTGILKSNLDLSEYSGRLY